MEIEMAKSTESAPDEFTAGSWTIKVSGFEPSTFELQLKADGSVTGERQVDDMRGPVSGKWDYDAPKLTLDLSSELGLRPQPVLYEFELTDADAQSAKGSDSDGHKFKLHRA